MSGVKRTKIARESQLSTEQVKLAVPALFSYLEKTSKNEKQLFSEDAAFWLLMSLKKIPTPDKKPKLLKVPNSFSSGSEVCLFTKLPGKRVKEQLKAKGVTCVTKVISVTKLRKNYKSFQDKRTLCSQYDAFLCDERIYHLIPKAIGKTFFSRKKEPTPVDLTKVNLDEEIKRALNSTKLRLGNGTCSAIKVGHSGQSQEELVENIVAVVDEIAKKIPRGWSNIQCIHLKTAESIALPLYNSLPDVENVIERNESPKKKKKLD
ncbi:ribosomal L1 domain-containing protein 1-like [Rhopilema esculentum]|uniref:ribosomal L1 domain-containing protein 1-like n=1 Tax=Rhopilema esculentum TaxID=499914 RepID=UPI0031CF384D|eukprot:gene9053-16699_t